MVLENLGLAFAAVFEIKTVLLIFAGTFAGIVAGAIPGFTIAMAVILTLPFTFGMTPLQGSATMMGVFVGGYSGGLISGTLLGIPGTPSSVATTFDGFPMARQGKPGLALGVGIWSSFFGGLIGAVLLVLFAPPIALFGLKFGPWEFFALIAFALTIIASLASESMLKGGIAGLMGLLIATIGDDDITAISRFDFGIDAIKQGFGFLPVLIGLFAFAQLMSDIEGGEKAQASLMDVDAESVSVEHGRAVRIILSQPINLIRSACIGVFVGALPAAGGSVSNILSYDQAKKASRHPEKFGTGIPDGIIASEAANNGTAGGALITMIALGIPGDISVAVMLGALLIHNVIPSPTFINDEPVLVYGIFVAFFLAHFVMIGLQAVGMRVFLKVAHLPKYILASSVLFFCATGVFALHNITFDIWTLFWFGALGYLMKKFGFPLAPMILGVILGDLAEVNLNRAYMSDPDPLLFFTRPISLFFVILALMSLVFPFWQRARHQPWTALFLPVSAIVVSIPFWISPGVLKLVGLAFAVVGAFLIFKQLRNGAPARE
ncbi:MAG: tripartite tricarboxylate transporter permease [Nitrospinota bacterium]|jgi:putative tricarboxylic transport membrane protein|nr:tripartite tricarboxylate transporter permease [Nitrospinota bacterium]